MADVCSMVLIVGDVSRPEFQTALGTDAGQQSGWQFAADVHAAAAAIESGAAVPDVIVVAQAYPGEIGGAAVERLRRLCPLARLVGLLSTWCEGEARSGHPWPGVARIAWHQWPWRGPRQLAALAAGHATPLALPATATAEEAALADIPSAPASKPARIVIVSPHRAMAAMLAAACESWGLETMVGWVDGHRPGTVLAWSAVVGETHADEAQRGSRTARPTLRPEALLFDCDELNEAAVNQLTELIDAHIAPHVAVLANFPRLDDVLPALAAGAAVVFAKPVDLNDLHAWLAAALAAS